MGEIERQSGTYSRVISDELSDEVWGGLTKAEQLARWREFTVVIRQAMSEMAGMPTELYPVFVGLRDVLNNAERRIRDLRRQVDTIPPAASGEG